VLVRKEQGATIIEVLVAIILVVVGLLGLAGLQSRVSLAEVESFQRTQAVVLAQDMVSRINANRRQAESYVTSAALGTGGTVQDCSTQTGPARDLCEWNNELLGASEALGGTSVGAMTGARGCVEELVNSMPRQFRVSVVWQGTSATVAPGSTSCGSGQYADDKLRRAVTATVEIGCLQNDPASTLCISNF
jgi:type IV pilus assembly protein PilV